MAAAEMLAPHLGRAARLVSARCALAHFFDGGRLADYGAPAVIVTRAGEVVEGNRGFLEKFGGGPRSRAGGQFRLNDPGIRAAIETFLAPTSNSDYANAPSQMIETGHGWRMRLFKLNRLRRILGGGVDHCLILFESAPVRENDANALRRKYDLTDTEASIAQLVASGRTPVEIAAERSCGITTVRWHIRQIYAKIGVSSRAGLAERFSVA